MMMPRPEDTEFMEYVDQLIESTRSGKVEWRAANPSTVTWEAEGARLSLQRLERTRPGRTPSGLMGVVKTVSYIFQAFEVGGGAVKRFIEKMSIESESNEPINRKLDTLYDVAKTAAARKGLDFLKGVLPRA
jgi:hypothetical protein